MNMKQVFEQAEDMQNQAREVIRDSGVIELWESIGATVNLVGSLRTGLLLGNRDVDFHIYTDPFDMAESFSVMSRLAENPHIKKILLTKHVDDADKSLDWHAYYEAANGKVWKMDMIHLLPDSPFAGYFEKVADRINAVLTDETRQAILAIKYAMPHEKKVMSILVYQAVIEGGVRDIESFWKWNDKNQAGDIITWMP